MKKIIAFVLVSILALSFAGCSKHTVHDKQTNDGMQNEWGITLQVENVTPSGLSLVCHQSGGNNVSQLETGSFFVIQKLEGTGWVDVAYAPHEYDIAWTAEAWLVPKESTITWDVNWEWLYGELPAGEYRIGKDFMNFRGTGDYDNEVIYADFTVE